MVAGACLYDTEHRDKFSFVSLCSKIFSFFLLLLFPPFISMFASYYMLWKKRSMFHYLFFAFFSSLTIISFAPIWDTITHYGVLNIIMYYNQGLENLTNYYYILELLIVSDEGLNLLQYNYFCLIVYTFLIFGICCLLSSDKESYNPVCIFLIFTYVGLFFINGWTRFSIAVVLVFLAQLFTKRKFFFCLYLLFAFYLGLKFHKGIIMLLLAVPVYMFSAKRNFNFVHISLLIILIFIMRFLFEFYFAPILGMEEYVRYLSEGNANWFPSDYIVRPVRMVVCIFFYYLICRNMSLIKSRWLLSLFLTAFVLQLIFICNYVIWERITNIALITGIIISYPVLCNKERACKLPYSLFSCFFAFFMFIYCLRPMLLEAQFKNLDRCREVAMRTLYVPSFLMLNIEKYGFSNALYDETTYNAQ